MSVALLRQLLKGLLRAPLAQLITVALIAASLSLLAVSLCLTFNLERLSQRWEEGGELLVVLQAGLSEERYHSLSAQIEGRAEVRQAQLTTPSDAQRDIIEALGSSTFEVGGALEALPATLELSLTHPERAEEVARLRASLLDLEGIQEVESVTEGEGLLAQLYALRRALRSWLWVLGLWVGASVAFVIAQLVRLNLLQRRLEIEVWVSVGASELFILGPLMFESALQTALGAWLALSLVNEVTRSLALAGSQSLSLLQLELTPLPPLTQLAFVGAAALLGVLSSVRAARASLRAQA